MAEAKTQGQAAPLVRPLRLDDYADVETITPDQCIAHLKILSAIADLRDSISRTDQLFSIDDRQIGAFEDTARMTKAHALLREKRWEIYVARAVDRFTTWFMTCVNFDALGSNQGLVTLADIEKGAAYHRLPEWNYRITWSQDLLPPLGSEFSPLLRCSRVYMLTANRCPDGLACVHAQSPRLFGRLSPSRKDELLGHGHAMESCQCMHR
jgi:hypothetical protein